MGSKTKEVVKKAMTWKMRGLFTLLIGIGTIIYGLVLNYLGDSNPYLDSFTTVCSVFAMVISIKMYAEQWIIWVVVNIASVIMWAIAFSSGNDNIATLLMWCVYLINAVIMLIKWMKEANKK